MQMRFALSGGLYSDTKDTLRLLSKVTGTNRYIDRVSAALNEMIHRPIAILLVDASHLFLHHFVSSNARAAIANLQPVEIWETYRWLEDIAVARLSSY